MSQSPFDQFARAVKENVRNIDVDSLKKNAAKAGDAISKNAAQAGKVINKKADEIKDAASSAKKDIEDKVTELDRMLEKSITDYNEVYTLMNDKGMQLYVERCRSVDTITFIESLINSIANHPKSFDSDFEEIKVNRKKFKDACEFADRELNEARKAAGSAGAGLEAGATVAMMAPTVAMWIASTFGAASTGVAISTLSGAAAESAALAWLGGGAVAAGGGGMAAGNALLALAGPVGWTIAGATLLTSIILFSKNKMKLNKEKNEEIEEVKKNTEKVKELDAEIKKILDSTALLRSNLNTSYSEAMSMYGKDYMTFSVDQKQLLGSLVNNTKALSVLFDKNVQ